MPLVKQPAIWPDVEVVRGDDGSFVCDSERNNVQHTNRYYSGLVKGQFVEMTAELAEKQFRDERNLDGWV